MPKAKKAKNKPASPKSEKELALEALAERKKNPPTRINNADLYAGSPMYYYCQSCGHQAACLPETHREPPPSLCTACRNMKDMGWLE